MTGLKVVSIKASKRAAVWCEAAAFETSELSRELPTESFCTCLRVSTGIIVKAKHGFCTKYK